MIPALGQQASLFTFAGARINYVLAQVLKRETGVEAQVDNRRLTFAAPSPWRPCLAALERLREPGYFRPQVVAELVAGLPRGRLSRFQPYLPPALESRFLAERLLDLEGAAALAGEAVHVERGAGG